MPGTAAGTQALSSRMVFSATSWTPACFLLLAGDHHIGLQDHAFQRDPLEPLLEGLLEHALGHFVAAVDVVVAVHQHFGLDDRHDLRGLAQRGVTRQRMGIDVIAVMLGIAVALRPISITARHLANRAP